MATEVTQDNLNQVVREIERVLVEFDNVTPVAGLICDVCGRKGDLEDLDEFARGAAYVPPDPFPIGTRVVDKRWRRPPGVVIRNDIFTKGEHQHQRIIEVLPDGFGTRDLYYIYPGMDDTVNLTLANSEAREEEP